MGGIGTCPISVHPNAASGLISVWIKLGHPQKLGVSAPKNEHPVAGKIQWKKQIIHDNICPNHLFIVAWSKKVPNWMDLLESDQLAGLNCLNIGPWAMWISAVWWRRVYSDPAWAGWDSNNSCFRMPMDSLYTILCQAFIYLEKFRGLGQYLSIYQETSPQLPA